MCIFCSNASETQVGNKDAYNGNIQLKLLYFYFSLNMNYMFTVLKDNHTMTMIKKSKCNVNNDQV